MTKRRPKGEGSVYRRKDGRVVGEYEDASGRKRYITSKTKTKAQMRALVRRRLRTETMGLLTTRRALPWRGTWSAG